MTALPNPSPASARWSWWGVAGMVAAVLGLPTLLAFGPAPRRPFDEESLRLLKRQQPRCVLLGDSMLETRIDSAVLNRVAGERCFVLAQPGSSSATWFLMLKNFVAAQKPPPRTVIILFRDRQLTLPARRTEGEYRQAMEPFMRDEEPMLEKLAGAARQPAGMLDRLLQAIYPEDRRRDLMQEKLKGWALDFVASSRDYQKIQNDTKRVFDTKGLRVGNVADEQLEGGADGLDPNDHDFARAVGSSFLPHMIDIARAKGIALVFYEVKRRPDRDGTADDKSATDAAYEAALRAYLEQSGARFFDESREPDVTVNFYGSGDHVAPAMMARYTELFWKNVAPLVAAEPAR